MTIQEAIGAKLYADAKTGKKLSHSEMYGKVIEYLGGLDVVARFIPFPMETIREKLKSDPHLNNTPMKAWDAASGFVCDGIDCRPSGGLWPLYRKHGITCASNSEGVCILKEAARRLVEREEAAK